MRSVPPRPQARRRTAVLRILFLALAAALLTAFALACSGVDKASGAAAPGNPFEGQLNMDARVYAYGFRNAFDFDFHPETGTIFAVDNGEQVDENRIVPGGNYGHPDVIEPSDHPDFIGRPAVSIFAGLEGGAQPIEDGCCFRDRLGGRTLAGLCISGPRCTRLIRSVPCSEKPV